MSMPLGNRPAPASWLPILNPTGLLLLPEPAEPPDLAFAAAAPASLDEAIIAPARVGEGVGVGRFGRLGEGGGMPGAVVENADIFQSETILTNGPLPLKLGNPFGEKSVATIRAFAVAQHNTGWIRLIRMMLECRLK